MSRSGVSSVVRHEHEVLHGHLSWDEDAQVWYVAETDVPGLATEAATVEEVEDWLLRMVPELVAVNGGAGTGPLPARTSWRSACP